jgi:hypothetical protein
MGICVCFGIKSLKALSIDENIREPCVGGLLAIIEDAIGVGSATGSGS